MIGSPWLKAWPLYISCTAKNQLRLFVNLIKSPKNLAVGFFVSIVALLVMWLLPIDEFKQLLNDNVSPPYIFLLPMALELAIRFLYTSNSQCFARGLKLQQAEIAVFFASPLSRRQIVWFKLLNLFKIILLIILVIAAVSPLVNEALSFLRVLIGLTLTSTIMIVGYYMLRYGISFLALHRLNFLNRLIFIGCIVLIAYCGWQILSQSHTLFNDLSRFNQTPAYAGLQQSVDWLITPTFSSSWALFFQTIGLPLLVAIALCGLFFSRRFPYAFFAQQIAGASADEETNNSKSRPLPKYHSTGNAAVPRLSAVGPQYKALIWKSVMASPLLRSRSMRWLVATSLMVLPIICTLPIPLAALHIIKVLLITLAASMVLISPWILRGGLRHQMPHMDLFKTLPIEGRQLMLGTMVLPVLITFTIVAIATISLGLIATNLNFYLNSGAPIISEVELFKTFTTLPVLLGLILARYTIHNLWALYLPSFVTFDKLDDNKALPLLFRVIISPLVLGVLLILPYLTMMLVHSFALSNDWSRLIAANAGSLVLIAQSLALIYCSESRYQRFDISLENTTR